MTEALSAYDGVIAAPTGAAYANQARLAKARIHESMNHPKEAIALYDVVLGTKTSALANEALIRKANLLRVHPELDKPAILTNTLKVLPAPAPAPAAAPAAK